MRNLNSYMVRPRLLLSSENDTLDTPPASAALNTAARPRGAVSHKRGAPPPVAVRPASHPHLPCPSRSAST